MPNLKLTSETHPCVIVAGEANNRTFVSVHTSEDGALTFTDNVGQARRFRNFRTANNFIREHTELVDPRAHAIKLTVELDPSL